MAQPINLVKPVTSPSDIIFTSGPNGSIRFVNADGEELLELGPDFVAVLGEKIDFEQLRQLIKSLKSEDTCSCSPKQLLLQGCTCGNI